MAKVTCIVGLPGSGKTTLSKKLGEQNPDIRIFDDVINSSVINVIQDILTSGEDVIIIDVNFIFARTRANVERLLQGYNVEWIFFENDPDRCRANVKRRYLEGDVREVEETICKFSKRYDLPKNVKPMEVWSG